MMVLAPFWIPIIFIFFGLYWAAWSTIWMLIRRCIRKFNSVNPKIVQLIWFNFGFDLWVIKDMLDGQKWTVDGFEHQKKRQNTHFFQNDCGYDIYVKPRMGIPIQYLFDDYYYLNNENI